MLQKGTTEGNFGRAVPYSEWLGKLKQLWLRSVQKLEKGANLVFLKWGLLLFIVGVMLGRAAILSDLYPFALPFFAAVFVLRKNKALLAATAVLIGTIWD